MVDIDHEIIHSAGQHKGAVPEPAFTSEFPSVVQVSPTRDSLEIPLPRSGFALPPLAETRSTALPETNVMPLSLA